MAGGSLADLLACGSDRSADGSAQVQRVVSVGLYHSYPESWVARSWQRRLVRMKVVCASCEREGKPSYLGEREPYDNPATTHGICSRHKEQALEALPSESFPDAEMLIVVRRNDTDLYEYLLQRFAGVPGVRVIQERRQPDRPVDERDRKERRIRQVMVSSLGYTIVRFKRKPPAGE